MGVTWGGGADDADLLARVAAGDRAAFDAFYARTAPWLTVRLRRRCRDDDLVAEVVQDTFLAVWRTAGGYAGRGDVAGWVWTIAVHKLVDAVRRRTARGGPVGDPRNDQLLARPAEDEALAGAVGGDLGVALDRLSPQLRAVLQATVLDGMSTREAAVLLGVPEGTVKTRARRARLQLREALS